MNSRFILSVFFALSFSASSIAQTASPFIPSIPAQSYSGGTLPIRGGPSIVCFGDSECTQGFDSNPAGSMYYSSNLYHVGTTAASYLGWLQSVSGNSFVLDYYNLTYSGNSAGIYYIDIATQGTGCPANTTFTVTPSAASSTTYPGPSTHNAAAVSFTTDANGNTPVPGAVNARAFEPVGTSQGGGYSGVPTFTNSMTCTVPPTFAYALTGSGMGVNGDRTAWALLRVNYDLCAMKPDWAYVKIGVNDLANSITSTTVNHNTLAIIQAMEACGIRVAIGGISPVGQSYGGWSNTLDKARQRVNALRRQVASLTQNGATSYTYNGVTYSFPTPIVYIETDGYCADPTQSNWYAKAACVQSDGIHQSAYSAQIEMLAFWAQIKGIIPQPLRFTPNSQLDVYDATNNPQGNLLSGVFGLFGGTTGTATSPCSTSSGIAGSWQLTFTAGTGGATSNVSCVGTLETTRLDGKPGTRQVITISDASGNSTYDTVTFAIYPNLTSNLNSGDMFFLEGDVDVSNKAQVESFGCELRETNSGVVQSSTDLKNGAISSTTPEASSAQLATWEEAKNLPNFGATATGSYRFHIQTAPIPFQPSGDTGDTIQCVAYLNAASGTATLTAKLSNFAVRKSNVQ